MRRSNGFAVIVRAMTVPAAIVLALALAACGTTPTPAPATGAPTDHPSRASPAPTAASSPSPSQTFAAPDSGFAFDAESVIGFYETRGYVCADAVPSEQGPGYLLRTCRLVDVDGRTRVIGLVTDANGDLTNGYASMRGRVGEAFLAPEIALESLAGFLGAMLGEERGTELVPWLAGHLGDAFAETTSADLLVATYTEQAAGRTVLVVEVARGAYLGTPSPGASAAST